MMIEAASLKTIVLVLFGMALIWLIKILVKQEFETLMRALLMLVFFGAVLLYLNQTKLDKISWKGVKEDIFPSAAGAYVYEAHETLQNGIKTTQYDFQEPGPKLNLTMDADGKNLHITDIEPVNKVLAQLGLPPVTEGAQELSSLTGRLADVNTYRWENYDRRGVLILTRGLCRNKKSLDTFHCITRISVQNMS